jgi:hypothetical protein
MSPKDMREIARDIERVEASAWAQLYQAGPAEVRQRLGIRVERIGGATVLVFGSLNVPLVNHVVNLGMEEPATEEILDQISSVYRDAGVRFLIWLSAVAQPASLPGRLEARGMKRTESSLKLYRGVEPPPDIPTDLRVDHIGPESAQAFGEVLCAGYGLPPELAPWGGASVGLDGWRHYLAYDGKLPVATAALFVENGVGWLGMAATLPTHRRRGGQGALMARRIRDAAEMGCRLITTDTGEDSPEQPNPSYHNMLRTGFKLLYARSSYVSRQ